VNVALPALQADLHATITEVQWVIEAYALFLGALILVGGSIGDQFGRKKVFLAGMAFFTGASILCGVATSATVLIVGRALQGVGAAFLVPGSLAIISATFDDAERGRAIGTWSGFSAITAAIGPVAGGWLIEHVSWRAVFFLNVPLALIVLALSFRFMEESRDPSRTARIDWIGAGLAVLGLGGVVFGLLEWPPLGAGHPLVVSALAIGTASLVLFVVVERRMPAPMLPLGLFLSRTFALTNVLTLLLYAALAVIFFILMNPIQVQGYSATEAEAAAAAAAHHVCAVAMVGWIDRAYRQPRTAYRRTCDGGVWDRLVCAARHRGFVRHDILSRGDRAWIRDGRHRGAADDDGDGSR
jgi:EmrB/QacA subfamily drug resistance transporter